ncbi:hypothetical protein Dalk_1869 [Desulfatibacillum aliphaticivorans]|uniref:Phage abortive infection protein n=1 Tax=Desulfatibacillum aliphaticivorans TaxID=218208 RepID=B8FEN9_DESAL|nr:putative phage abortive infection protein [Desulfatibacillum aliphaticivorans]ACL03566.1 hypothetical protein Dalk_1869 [Desulfatibacillum aliphaticivorans]
MKNKTSDRKWLGSIFWVSFSLLIVCLICTTFAFHIPWIFHQVSRGVSGAETWAMYGTFGDSFGSLNTFFSGLAFLGVIIAILLQRQDLEIQRKELRDSRHEAKVQRFESLFFNMLRLHHDIANSVIATYVLVGGEQKSGRRLIQEIVWNFSRKLEKETNKWEFLRSTFFREINGLRYYIFHIRKIFEIVNRYDGLELIDGNEYAEIALTHLSSEDLELIFYFGLHGENEDRLKPLIEKYHLLRDMPNVPESILEMRQWYKNSAFVRPLTKLNS